MKIQPYIDKLSSSKEYKNFQKKYPDAYLIAGFFVLDLEQGMNIHQIDYYIPSQKKIAAFTLDGGVSVQVLDTMNSKIPEPLNIKTNVDLDALEGILHDEMKNRNMTEDIKKIIAVLQNIGGKKIWNLNCILSGMEILKTHVEDESQTVLKMERTSMLELIKKVSPQALQALSGSQEVKPEDELQKLDKLSLEIEKEKEKLKGKLDKKVKS